jgi:hypothetical protein
MDMDTPAVFLDFTPVACEMMYPGDCSGKEKEDRMFRM